MFTDGLPKPDGGCLSICQGIFIKWQETLKETCAHSCWDGQGGGCDAPAGQGLRVCWGSVLSVNLCVYREKWKRGLKEETEVKLRAWGNSDLKRIRKKDMRDTIEKIKVRWWPWGQEGGWGERERGNSNQEELIISEFNLERVNKKWGLELRKNTQWAELGRSPVKCMEKIITDVCSPKVKGLGSRQKRYLYS